MWSSVRATQMYIKINIYYMKPFVKTKDAWDEAMEEIKKRQRGEIRAVSTGFPAFDALYFNGLERGWIVTLAGKSGSGKTAYLAQLMNQMANSNPDTPLAFIVFTYEMSAARVLQRMICNEYNIILRDLLSSGGDKLEQIKLDNIDSERIRFMNNISTFIERPLYPEQMMETLNGFRKEIDKRMGEGVTIVSVVDHMLLAKGAVNKNGLDDLVLMQNEYKKIDKNCIQINLSQLNRNYDDPIRFDPDKPSKHYPVKSDLYGSDFIYQTSDIVAVLSNPSNAGLEFYGPENYRVTSNRDNPMIYIHHLKNRDAGRGGIILPYEFIGQYYRFKEVVNQEHLTEIENAL